MKDYITIFVAEFTRRVRSRPFLIGLAVGLFVMLAMTRLPSLMERLAPASAKRVVLVADGGLSTRASALLAADFTVAATLTHGDPDAAMLRAHDADTAIVVERRGGLLAVVVFATHPSTISANTIRRDLLPLELKGVTGLSSSQIRNAIDMPVDIRSVASRFGSPSDEAAGRSMATAFLFLLYLTVVMNSQLVMSSVAEEKTSRIAELLVATINPRKLLVGKILAATALALVQLIVWTASALYFGGSGQGAAASAGGDGGSVGTALFLGNILTPATLLAFFTFFLIGLLQLSTLLASAGSMINRPEDIGSLTMPFLLPVMGALVIGIASMRSPDAPWSVVASLIPVISPFVMFARIAVGVVPVWQLALSIGLNLAALALIAWGSGRVYRVGMLFTGRAPSFVQILKALRTA